MSKQNQSNLSTLVELQNILWQPTKECIESSNINKFIHYVNSRYLINISSFEELYKWSVNIDVNDLGLVKFWSAFWDFSGIISESKGTEVLIKNKSFIHSKWFPEAKLNYAENLLQKRNNDIALQFWGENKIKRKLTCKELYESVSKIQQFMIEIGIKKMDRIALFIPNIPEAIIFVLAAASLGAISSLCSPDFGIQGVLDRFLQIEPDLFIYSDKYIYNGKIINVDEKVYAICEKLPSVKTLVRINYFQENENFEKKEMSHKNEYNFQYIINKYIEKDIEFTQVPFSHPLYIMYSSGTTGIPKCIVHSVGGTLIQHLKEHQLHCNMRENDTVFYYTTCGWMMWQWIISALASKCTVLLYDGSPFSPSEEILFEYISSTNAVFFGVSAKYIDSLKKSEFSAHEKYLLPKLKTIASTGSPLVAESFDYVYDSIKKDVCLSSLSGGTDIISCFVLGNPIGKVYRGEIQTRGLGMKVEVFNDFGESIQGEKGELVCIHPFPSQPVSFWNDPEFKKYESSYFGKFGNIWCHGDFMELTSSGGAIIYGRSDSTLNPGGIRIGTAEIYRQVEQFPEILESIVIDQKWDSDSRIVLFVRMREGFALSQQLIQDIKNKLKTNCSIRHIPAKIIAVPDIPRTKSGKIVELAVSYVVNSREVKNKDAMANPEALLFFQNCEELKTN